ncbi:vomeronasal type-2 receptor 26-like [Zootoca vivipara]|uniref:vomeronasal type-2 receptor 26-like n=1 Tax=Zootoca vivipara TaxID=8524 RepID=UPI00293BA030|nr:vomeronasal type-2 receptor 26-like [Zootoca vivipara]
MKKSFKEKRETKKELEKMKKEMEEYKMTQEAANDVLAMMQMQIREKTLRFRNISEKQNEDIEKRIIEELAKWLEVEEVDLELPGMVPQVHTVVCSGTNPVDITHEWYEGGDLVIGGIASLIRYIFPILSFKKHPSHGFINIPVVITKYYQHILALVFAVDEINENRKILPNATLGFHIYDSYFDSRMTYQTTLDLLFKAHHFVPNYICGIQKNVVGIIGGLSSDTSSSMADVLRLYKIPQISYGSFQQAMNDQIRFSSFYRMVPNERLQYQGIIQLLLYFGWKWVGVITPDNEAGERFLQTIESMIFKNQMCSAFTETIEYHLHFTGSFRDTLDDSMRGSKLFTRVLMSKANAVVIYGESQSIGWLLNAAKTTTVIQLIYHPHMKLPEGKVWITTAQMDFLLDMFQKGVDSNLQMFHGAISFAIHSKETQSFQDFLQHVNPYWEDGDGFIKDLHSFLKRISFNNSAGDEIALNEHGELEAGFDITNLVTFQNGSYVRVKVGRLDPQSPPGKELTINAERIKWHSGFTQEPPLSICNANCRPGYGKRKKEGEKFCCYDCDPCPRGMFSNEKAMVLGIFIKHRDTAIVKANNRSLTYILLISLLLCFLCSLMFIGMPNKATCPFRQTAFGIVFSVALSSILAKTISVVWAFMATKPDSKIRKWVGKKLAYSIVLSCSVIQVGICASWLATSAPFPDVDMHSMTEEIIFLCNEGSVLMFYCVLGYMGFLATVSFTVAFLARKLPDSFNEAKFITFSMLVFCSVWFSFIPTYLSTRGKYMVAVEIFSILASSAGLLGCIFSPKCYIIVVRPELNNREQLIRRKM